MESNRHIFLSQIKKSSDYLTLKTKGKREWPSSWLLLNYNSNGLGILRFGVTANRKVGNAIVRNKLKRWSREFFREFSKQNEANNLGVDINVIFKPMEAGFYKGLTYSEFSMSIQRGLNSIRKKL